VTAIRKPAVAGTFYPKDADNLSREVADFLSAAAPSEGPTPKAIIAPHAGYRYSGAIAASAYAKVIPSAADITRVILLGPCHRVAVRGLALSGADAFETPLGSIPIDKEAEARLNDLAFVQPFPATHEQEHALEVHLPFLQKVLGDFTLVPIVVGEATPDMVAHALDRLWGGPETLIVISSDLSHYLDYASARDIDQRTTEAITSLDPSKIERGGACGRFPVGGLLHVAKQRGMRVETLDLRNSGDTAGTKDKVVGYGSWAFYEPESQPKKIPLNISLKPKSVAKEDFEAKNKQLLVDHGQRLLTLADAAIKAGFEAKGQIKLNVRGQPQDLMAEGASFVTLKTASGQLRGCIGSPTAHKALAVDVAENALKAAFRDPRFKPITPEEYETLKMSISVLSPQTPITIKDEDDLLAQLRPGVDGLVIADGGRRALFLPSVWEQLSTPTEFLAHLKRKAGMATDHWSSTFTAHRFIAEEVKGAP
jgi:AmmeMemoRadiSam system protein B/AmmeMemoRadiSam system protein A